MLVSVRAAIAVTILAAGILALCVPGGKADANQPAIPSITLTPDGQDLVSRPGDSVVASGDSLSTATPAMKIERRFAAHLGAEKRRLYKKVRLLRREAQHWAFIMGTGVVYPATRRLAASSALRTWQNRARLWSEILKATRWRAQHPPHAAELMCIHSHEGSWQDTRNPKYNGGLQMDKYFEAGYGARFVREHGGYIARDGNGYYAVGGHAYTWTPLEQLWAAEQAVKSRGFQPWPLTSVMCGL